MLFSSLFVPDPIAEATSDRAWIQAMLDFEAALARAEARAGVVPEEAAAAIAGACRAESFDPVQLGREARAVGNPAAPLVSALTAAVPGEFGGWVHWGATSQDVVDTAAMLVAVRTHELIDEELMGVADACAALADAHRSTLMPGRTLLQHALPITFGLKAAGWLWAVELARDRLAAPVPVQLGGAVGTLASLGSEGARVLGFLADELHLAEPALPWHTARMPIADLGAQLALAAGTLEKIALDVKLLAQTEVGEVSEAFDEGRGGSSTLPHKRNPVGAALAIGCARRAQGAAAVLLGAMAQEHERAAGPWHAEWGALTEALAMTGGAAAAVRESLAGLEVHAERMRANLDATGGLVMGESVATAMAARIGRGEAKRLVGEASRRAVEAGRPLRDELVEDAQVRELLSEEEIDRALDPAGYLGSAETFVERALAQHREEST